MHTAYIRTWQNLDLEEIANHLLIIGDLTGDCNKCRQIGIEFLKSSFCPNCRTDFKYVASRRQDGLPVFVLKKILEHNPQVTFIELKDFKLCQDRLKAKQFFKA
ncbi:MAG: hypothetical protein V1674_05450 [Candidatus Omnitrophota bacterium]